MWTVAAKHKQKPMKGCTYRQIIDVLAVALVVVSGEITNQTMSNSRFLSLMKYLLLTGNVLQCVTCKLL